MDHLIVGDLGGGEEVSSARWGGHFSGFVELHRLDRAVDAPDDRLVEAVPGVVLVVTAAKYSNSLSDRCRCTAWGGT